MTIFRWMVATALLVAFVMLAIANWTPVEFHMPNGSVSFIRLPLLLAAAFVAGWLPTWLVHIGARSGWKRRIAKAERGAIDVPRTEPLPSQAQPTIVPPAGA